MRLQLELHLVYLLPPVHHNARHPETPGKNMRLMEVYPRFMSRSQQYKAKTATYVSV